MDAIAHAAEEALLEHPHPALRLSELCELISRHIDRHLDGERLRTALEAHPDRFRILEMWRSRWSTLDPGGAIPVEAWVVATADRDPSPSGRDTAGLLRESVRRIARGLDGRSSLDLGRWQAIALAERAARRALTRRAS
jgi:hypothetical protein